jgi:hypothetical protein
MEGNLRRFSVKIEPSAFIGYYPAMKKSVSTNQTPRAIVKIVLRRAVFCWFPALSNLGRATQYPLHL